ncbi:hypothetical protein [Cellulomonas triticagri]|uniref:hypothetical protein n=1 Tax=Cellulomonas triticagri TaxID=2483352 RepID=UPI0018F608B8|nr:hypothetical protein [Cellulomonas triticagri]
MTADLMARLRRHYIRPGARLAGGVFLDEVGWNGSAGTSRADALFVGFTSASGRVLIGHEVKASRADWLAELSKPGKADPWADQCHAWYLVTAPGVVRPGELPVGWGLMLPGRTRTQMQVATPAQVRLERTPSWDAVRSIMGRLDTLQAEARVSIRASERARVADELAGHDQALQEARDAARVQRQHLVARLEAVEEALGGVVLVDPDGRPPRGRQVTADELADLAALLRVHRDLREAARALAGRYPVDTARLRAAVDDLDQALAAARAVVPSTTTVTPSDQGGALPTSRAGAAPAPTALELVPGAFQDPLDFGQAPA